MSRKIHKYEAWEERTISEVNVQYYLRSRSGNSLLAAEGNENSKGHMIYVVAKAYLEAFGSRATINANTKWTKRRDVVKWLASLVRDDDWPPTKLDLDLVRKHRGDGSSLDEEEKLTQEDLMKGSSKKLSSLVQQKQDSVRLDATNPVPPKEAAASELTTLKFNTDLSSIEANCIKPAEPKPHLPKSFQVGENIQVLCQDSGMRGCWFRCKIVKVSKKSFKVHYNDAHNVEASGKLEEWVPASRLADPDKRNLRHSGRLTVRPCPPKEPFSSFFEVGASVESWWNNGWWESFVVTCVSLSNNDSYHVFLPGERRFLSLHRKDIRVAKDWINNTWVAVKPNPDILLDISSNV
ncbi:uncharacterized protein LOC141686761 [Apium graveolens]|uniref:uncharacterized protein LOC141686761 n=1 Tax=Apium graveolens TaxID=4045 RepID=UPI003D7AC3D8